MNSISNRVRGVLAIHAKTVDDPATIGDFDDLYAAGMTSHATVNLMLALEDEFDVEFLVSQLGRSSFQSIHSICQVLSALGVNDPE